MLSSLFTGRIPPANSMHFWCFHHSRQCTRKVTLAHVILDTIMCIVLQAEVPTAPARNPYSHKIASRVARECKQPSSSLHHNIAVFPSPKCTINMFLYSLVYCKHSFSLPHTTYTQIPMQFTRKHPPKAPIYTFLHPVHAITATLHQCNVLARPRRLTRTSRQFPRLPGLHWGNTRVSGTLTRSAQALGSFANRTVSHWRRQGATTGARHSINILLHCALSKSRRHLVPHLTRASTR